MLREREPAHPLLTYPHSTLYLYTGLTMLPQPRSSFNGTAPRSVGYRDDSAVRGNVNTLPANFKFFILVLFGLKLVIYIVSREILKDIETCLYTLLVLQANNTFH